MDPRKAENYRANHDGGPELLVPDVADVRLGDLPDVTPDLVWASFPCQDLSLAGPGAGLAGARSGAFRPFWELVRQLRRAGRAPKLIALENVCGALTSNGGRDFRAIAEAVSDLDYRFGALVVDAVHFLPQSRPRVFLIGVRGDLGIPAALTADGPGALWHSPLLIAAQRRLSTAAAEAWLWWRLPSPAARNVSLEALLGSDPPDASWRSAAGVEALLAMMSVGNRAKVAAAQAIGCRVVGTVYRRTRKDAHGMRRQRAEARFDGVAGCLRTPAGGSSRQTVLVVEGDNVRARLLSAREAATLMGLPETYVLPARYNDAYKLAGDGVAVPVVKHLAENILDPILHPCLTRVA
nr:DNA (cytosine-5-)-methyltransferase [Amaricoccus sp.]